jgi:hypothetical protein
MARDTVKNVPPAEETSNKDKQKAKEENEAKTDGEKKDEVEELVSFT